MLCAICRQQRKLEQFDALLYGGATHMARGLDLGLGAVLATTVSALEHHCTHVLFAQRTVDGVRQLLRLSTNVSVLRFYRSSAGVV